MPVIVVSNKTLAAAGDRIDPGFWFTMKLAAEQAGVELNETTVPDLMQSLRMNIVTAWTHARRLRDQARKLEEQARQIEMDNPPFFGPPFKGGAA